MKKLPSLTDKIQKSLNLAGLSDKTKDTYYHSLILCKKYFKKSLILLSRDDLEDFFSELISQKKSQSLIRVRYSALKFLFTKVYNRPFPLDYIPAGKLRKTLPVVFNLQEIKDLLDVTTNSKHKAILSVSYSGGLRISETHNLKVSDIDSKRMTIRITKGKGKKDRYTLLAQRALEDLRQYYHQYHPEEILFPGYYKDKPLSLRSLQYILIAAKKKAGILKPATFHTLRHSFATHLYEQGTGLVHIQRFLGHKSINTTMVYINLAKPETLNISSPLDSQE